MIDHRHVANEIASLLGLNTPPIGVAFVNAPPDGVEQSASESPSTCSFWRQAERGVFYATARQHFNCEVGALVMGFDLPEDIMQGLGGVVEMMVSNSYLSAEEADKIPTVASRAAGVIYGPLAQFPTAPSAVVLWLTPKQAMLYNEAAGSASWAASPARVAGRPGCAAIPLAMHASQPALSFGCIGMRTFTEVAEDRMLAVVPGDQLAGFLDALRGIVATNGAMLSIYESRKAADGAN